MQDGMSISQQKRVFMKKKNFLLNSEFIHEKQKRYWMRQRGKLHHLDFTDDQLKKLKECFISLDDDRSGSIGVPELENPLIGLGFASSRREIEEMVAGVDEDGSG
mmetsp:Transcript_10311/g.15761  ORF Transcript_10311/g.15761 Transcript_10311/m.15761 type:complete len:105 (-) Transcript_10311:264-578(-)